MDWLASVRGLIDDKATYELRLETFISINDLAKTDPGLTNADFEPFHFDPDHPDHDPNELQIVLQLFDLSRTTKAHHITQCFTRLGRTITEGQIMISHIKQNATDSARITASVSLDYGKDCLDWLCYRVPIKIFGEQVGVRPDSPHTQETESRVYDVDHEQSHGRHVVALVAGALLLNERQTMNVYTKGARGMGIDTVGFKPDSFNWEFSQNKWNIAKQIDFTHWRSGLNMIFAGPEERDRATRRADELLTSHLPMTDRSLHLHDILHTYAITVDEDGYETYQHEAFFRMRLVDKKIPASKQKIQKDTRAKIDDISTGLSLPKGTTKAMVVVFHGGPTNKRAILLSNHAKATTHCSIENIFAKIYFKEHPPAFVWVTKTKSPLPDLEITYVGFKTEEAAMAVSKDDTLDLYPSPTGAGHSGQKKTLLSDFHQIDRQASIQTGAAPAARTQLSYTNPNPNQAGPQQWSAGWTEVTKAKTTVTPPGAARTPVKEKKAEAGAAATSKTPVGSPAANVGQAETQLALSTMAQEKQLDNLRSEFQNQVAALTQVFRETIRSEIAPIKAQQKATEAASTERFRQVEEQREQDAKALTIAQGKVKAEIRETREKLQEAERKAEESAQKQSSATELNSQLIQDMVKAGEMERNEREKREVEREKREEIRRAEAQTELLTKLAMMMGAPAQRTEKKEERKSEKEAMETEGGAEQGKGQEGGLVQNKGQTAGREGETGKGEGQGQGAGGVGEVGMGKGKGADTEKGEGAEEKGETRGGGQKQGEGKESKKGKEEGTGKEEQGEGNGEGQEGEGGDSSAGTKPPPAEAGLGNVND